MNSSMAAWSVKMKLEKLIKMAELSGVCVVVDADAVAIRLIPNTEAKEGDDLRRLGIVVKVHNACGGGSGWIGGHPITHGAV